MFIRAINCVRVLHCGGQVLSDRLLAYSDLVTGFLALKGDFIIYYKLIIYYK